MSTRAGADEQQLGMQRRAERRAASRVIIER
jgi:hypothetical protein